MNIVLRTAINEDAHQVAEVLLSSRKTFLPYACSAHSDAEVHQWVSDVLLPSGGVTVACAGDVVVGVLAVAYESGVSWIDQLYIAPSYTGKGIGTRMLVHARQSLPIPFRLYTFQANLRARSFYERHGFRAIELTDGSGNEEQCPDVLYELAAPLEPGA